MIPCEIINYRDDGVNHDKYDNNDDDDDDMTSWSSSFVSQRQRHTLRHVVKKAPMSRPLRSFDNMHAFVYVHDSINADDIVHVTYISRKTSSNVSHWHVLSFLFSLFFYFPISRFGFSSVWNVEDFMWFFFVVIIILFYHREVTRPTFAE